MELPSAKYRLEAYATVACRTNRLGESQFGGLLVSGSCRWSDYPAIFLHCNWQLAGGINVAEKRYPLPICMIKTAVLLSQTNELLAPTTPAARANLLNR